MMRISWKSLLSSFSLMLLSSVLLLLLFEVALRNFAPQPLYSYEQGLFTSSADFGYSLTPLAKGLHSQPEYSYFIRANSYGFRGKEPRFDAQYRVLILGDSFGMGQGVGEGKNLAELSQIYFNDRDVDVDIFNTSLAGYSGINQLKVLHKFVKTYKPKLVILLFYWNDVGARRSLSVQNGYLVVNAGNKYTAPFREWLNNHSHLYSLVRRFYYIQKTKGEVKRGLGGQYADSDMETTIKYINEMKTIWELNKPAFVVVLLPREGIYEGTAEFRRSKKTFIDMLTKNSVLARDWTLELPPNDRNHLNYKIDHHWNEAGHAYFAKVLTRLIEEMKKDD
ncbi:hypothetical protein MYX64_03525 [Nitrospinae bacterium AH_259_B05_G02_I21]|nr:hypothetical protein [Nitrospinae bacterium AH_259_B05_G02_I21]MDA2932349.1 hypothetical protein [Nitrospinae bacterium AH-259-F20]